MNTSRKPPRDRDSENASEGGGNQIRNVERKVCRPTSRSQRIAPRVMKLRRAAGALATSGDNSCTTDTQNGAVNSATRRGVGRCFSCGALEGCGSDCLVCANPIANRQSG